MPTPEQIQEAAKRLAETSAGKRGDWLAYMSDNGRYLWPHSYGAPGCQGDVAAWGAMVSWITGLPEDHRHRERLIDMLTVPATSHEMLSDALWIDQGAPIVQVGHRLAAAMICTRLPTDIELHTPWRAWILELPTNLLPLTDSETGSDSWLRYCLVRVLQSDVGPLWSITGFAANNRHQIGSRNLTAEQLLAAEPDSPDYELTALDWELDDASERTIVCLKRLVANLLVTMTERHECCQQVGIHRPTSPASLRRGEPPAHRRFMVRSEVAIDLRAHVRDYCSGRRRGSAPTVQSIICGHWRRVAHGPRQSLRRWKWISPTWRGPLGSPIKSPLRKVE